MTGDTMTNQCPMTNSPAQPASGPPRPWVIGAGSFLRPRSWVIGQFLLLLLLFCGCTPPGPRALLKGQRLIQEGKYEQAVESLQVAARLLPKNAQAFNHLGLALHGNKQYARALVAYQKALELDHKLASARYNMGCLLLEQNDLTGATDQLTSYTLLQANSVDGWLKLASAQLRARKLDPAEKSFKTALGLQPRHPEALNGLGVIQLQRRRPQEALNYFNVALTQNPSYGPALLNAALLSQQYLNNRPAALEKYRQYLALQPRPPNWEAVSAVANRLDAELNPPPPAPVAQSIAALPPPPPTNLAAKSIPPAPSPKTNFLARATPLPTALSNHPPQTVSAVVKPTNLTTT